MADRRTTTNDRVLHVDPWSDTQGVITKGTEWWLQMTRPLIPTLDKGGVSDQLLELVDKSFDSMTQLLEIQREFIKTFLEILPHPEQAARRMTVKASGP